MKPKEHHRIFQLVGIALLAHLALCWPLWWDTEDRIFPHLPIFNAWNTLPVWVNHLLVVSLVALLFFILWAPQKKWGMPALFLALVLLVAQDLNRLQPWLYFYLLVLVLHLAEKRHPSLYQSALQWLLAAVYAWGGFNKLTPYFAVDNFPWFCQAFVWTKPLGNIPALGYAFAVLEVSFAIGLLWRRTRPLFRWFVIAFHLFITAALSPLGLDWNAVVIPWNLAMAAMVWCIFSPQSPSVNSPKKANWLTYGMLGVPLFLAWVMPLFNIFHAWDEPLSWKMYCNTQTEASFDLSGRAANPALQAIWKRHAYDQGRKILLDDWAIAELKVPAYNSRRTHLQIARYLCGHTQGAADAGLLLFTVDRWDRSAERWEEIPCSTLEP